MYVLCVIVQRLLGQKRKEVPKEQPTEKKNHQYSKSIHDIPARCKQWYARAFSERDPEKSELKKSEKIVEKLNTANHPSPELALKKYITRCLCAINVQHLFISVRNMTHTTPLSLSLSTA